MALLPILRIPSNIVARPLAPTLRKRVRPARPRCFGTLVAAATARPMPGWAFLELKNVCQSVKAATTIRPLGFYKKLEHLTFFRYHGYVRHIWYPSQYLQLKEIKWSYFFHLRPMGRDTAILSFLTFSAL